MEPGMLKDHNSGRRSRGGRIQRGSRMEDGAADAES